MSWETWKHKLSLQAFGGSYIHALEVVCVYVLLTCNSCVSLSFAKCGVRTHCTEDLGNPSCLCWIVYSCRDKVRDEKDPRCSGKVGPCRVPYVKTLYIHTYIHTHIHAYKRRHINTYTYTQGHTHIHTHIHADKFQCLVQWPNGWSNGPMASPTVQWSFQWSNGRSNGPMVGPMVQWPVQWSNGPSNRPIVGPTVQWPV